MTQVGSGGAMSFQAWWFVESFSTLMLGWMAEMQGMLLSEEDQKQTDEKEQQKRDRDSQLGSTKHGQKRKRSDDEDDQEVQQRPMKKPDLSIKPTPVLKPTSQFKANNSAPSTANNGKEPEEPILPELPQHNEDEDSDAEMDELRRGGPIDLPSFPTGMTSPIKKIPQQAPHLPPHLSHNGGGIGDDSGIDLGMDVDVDHELAVTEAKKFNKRDWFLSSDPPEVIGVGLGVTA